MFLRSLRFCFLTCLCVFSMNLVAHGNEYAAAITSPSTPTLDGEISSFRAMTEQDSVKITLYEIAQFQRRSNLKECEDILAINNEAASQAIKMHQHGFAIDALPEAKISSKKSKKEKKILSERARYIQEHQLALEEGKNLNITKPSIFSCFSCFTLKK